MNKIALKKRMRKKRRKTNKEKPFKKENLPASVVAFPWISNLQMYSLYSNQTCTVKTYGLVYFNNDHVSHTTPNWHHSFQNVRQLDFQNTFQISSHYHKKIEGYKNIKIHVHLKIALKYLPNEGFRICEISDCREYAYNFEVEKEPFYM